MAKRNGLRTLVNFLRLVCVFIGKWRGTMRAEFADPTAFDDYIDQLITLCTDLSDLILTVLPAGD